MYTRSLFPDKLGTLICARASLDDTTVFVMFPMSDSKGAAIILCTAVQAHSLSHKQILSHTHTHTHRHTLTCLWLSIECNDSLYGRDVLEEPAPESPRGAADDPVLGFSKGWSRNRHSHHLCAEAQPAAP